MEAVCIVNLEILSGRDFRNLGKFGAGGGKCRCRLSTSQAS